ncbi:MAG: hypothetical protein ABIH48_01135 [Candidatus Falkowbacteria bacterium]
MSLQDLAKQKLLKEIKGVSIEQIKKRYTRAISYFQFAKNNINYSDKEIIYTNIYDAVRLGGEVLILSRGYRPKKGEGYHFIIMKAVKEIVNGDLRVVIKRIEKMRDRRNKIEYSVADVSDIELNQAVSDAYIFLSKVRDIIREKDNQQTLI